jgi:hypothetical protein
VLDYLCNRLYTLPEKDMERYLSQLGQLVYLRPGSSLERVLVDLCAQSLRIAVKARTGDQPNGLSNAGVMCSGHYVPVQFSSCLSSILGGATVRSLLALE